MNKTLNITIYQDPTKHVETFLQDWQLFGSVENTTEMDYKLISNDGKECTLTMTNNEITISGEISSKSFMLIDTLSKACEADKVLEGEFIDKDSPKQQQNPFGNVGMGGEFNGNFEIPKGMNSFIKITSLSKPKLILLMILALPLIIIMLPIILIIAIYKVIMFKLKFK